MRNLLIFVNPNKSFDDGYNSIQMAEAQIDNCLRFTDDIMLVTNFSYEYRGVKALEVPDDLFCKVDRKASKINTIIYLLENNLLPGLTWFHDLDAFQNNPIDFELKKDVGFTTYGYKRKWNTGSIFFRPEALDVFRWIRDCIYFVKDAYGLKSGEEPALLLLTDLNYNDINSRYETLDNTYNVGVRATDRVIEMSEKPIKVVHLPAHKKTAAYRRYGDSLSPELLKIFYEKFTRVPQPRQEVQ